MDALLHHSFVGVLLYPLLVSVPFLCTSSHPLLAVRVLVALLPLLQSLQTLWSRLESFYASVNGCRKSEAYSIHYLDSCEHRNNDDVEWEEVVHLHNAKAILVSFDSGSLLFTACFLELEFHLVNSVL